MWHVRMVIRNLVWLMLVGACATAPSPVPPDQDPNPGAVTEQAPATEPTLMAPVALAATARALLPQGIGREEFPKLRWTPWDGEVLSTTVTSLAGARSTIVERRNGADTLTFEYRWRGGFEMPSPGQGYESRHWWRYEAGRGGGAALSAEGGDPIPGVTVPLALAHHVDTELGFAVDYPAEWQVLDVEGRAEPSMRRFLVRAFDSGLRPGGDGMAPDYTIAVWMGEAAGATVTETVEAGLVPLDEGLRALFDSRCCTLLGGEPAMERTYPGFMSRWGTEEWVALHEGHEYRVQMWPTRWLGADSVADVQAGAALDTFLQTLTFIPIPTPTPAPTLTPAPTPTPRAPAVAPPAGLVFIAAGGLWQVGADGAAELLFAFERGEAVLSADGQRVAYTEWEGEQADVWVADRATGERRNVTATQDRLEGGLQWWPGRPHSVVMGSVEPEDLTGEEVGLGFLTVVEDDGSGHEVLDALHLCNAWPAPAADGRAIAYSGSGGGWLYRQGTGVERFEPAEHGLAGSYDLGWGAPSWSPDSRRLAWVAHIEEAGEMQNALVVFDLAAGTARVLYTHDTGCLNCVPPAAVWSGDGQWLAYSSPSPNADEAGVWILGTEGGEAYRIEGFDPIWSPDGKQMIVSRMEPSGEDRLWLVDVATWRAVELALPPETWVVAWNG